jgi:hypothetical protein
MVIAVRLYEPIPEAMTNAGTGSKGRKSSKGRWGGQGRKLPQLVGLAVGALSHPSVAAHSNRGQMSSGLPYC